jgi:uncharacterized surface protein with fasciclin (FAS1) repeats
MRLRLTTLAAAAALTAGLAAPPFAAAQAAKSKATTQAAAAQATGKATTDGPSTTMTQGTAKAVQQGAPAATVATTVATAGAAMPKVMAHGDLVETAKASGQFTIFLKAADATNLTAVLKNNQNLTVFAPTDAAFAALPPGQLDKLMADKPALQKLLTHHIINARVDSAKIKGAKGPVPSVAGDPIELDGSGEILKADNADIVQADVMATNGILQVVDKVLMPGVATAVATTTTPDAAASAAPASTTTTTTTTHTPAAPAKPKGK